MNDNGARSKSSVYATLLVFTAVALLAGGAMYWFTQSNANRTCGFCQRPLDPHLSVTAEIGGQKRQVCCARCALTEARQEHKRVRLLEAHDFPTGKTIDPAAAFYVDGSRAIACTHDAAPMDESKHMDHLAFDRCSPGAFTFARRADAEEFVRQNGGRLLTYAELFSEQDSGD